MYKFLDEIRRRRLFGVLALYFVGAWVVLQAADLAFAGWRIPDEAIRYVWIGAALLLPIAIAFSWRYDVSKGGIHRTPPEGDGHAPIERTDYVFLAACSLIAVIVVVGVAMRIVDMRVIDDIPADPVQVAKIPENSIAVLPFANISDEKENEYFSEGISNQLMRELARIPNLHVAARTSSFFFKGKNEDTRTIGRALGVRTLLEGSVRRAGDTVRVTAQLVDTQSGYQLWSRDFDARLDDVFKIQDEIAAAIVQSLRLHVGAVGQERLYRAPSVTAEAFDLYLKAMAVRGAYSDDAIVRSNEIIEDVIEMSPDFAHAYATLAYGHVLRTYYGGLTEEEAANLAEPLLNRARQLEPDLEDLYQTLGLLYTRMHRYEEANANFNHALEINPGHYGSHFNYGFSLTLQGRLREASVSYLKAQALDPLNGGLAFNLGALFMLMGNYDTGRAYMERALDIDPDRIAVKSALGLWNRRYGHLKEAFELGEEVFAVDPAHVGNNVLRTNVQLDFGNVREARRIVDAARELAPGDLQLQSAEASVLLAEEDLDAIYALAEQEYLQVDASPGDPLSRNDMLRVYRYGWASLLRGDNEAAATSFHWSAGGGEGILATTYDQMESLKYLALAYRRLGRFEESDRLIDQCLGLVETARANGWDTPQMQVRAAEIHAVRGDAAKAAELLTIAYERGFRDVHTLETGIFWQDIGLNPEIERIKVLIYEDIVRQSSLLSG